MLHTFLPDYIFADDNAYFVKLYIMLLNYKVFYENYGL